MHRETAAFDAAGAAMPQDKFEQVLVFAHVKLHNQGKLPLFLHQAMQNVTGWMTVPHQLRGAGHRLRARFQGLPGTGVVSR